MIGEDRYIAARERADHFQQQRNNALAEIHRLGEEVLRLSKALVEIRDTDPVDNALDPQRAARIAKEALE